MDGTSLTPDQEKINAPRQILPEAFRGGKIDREKKGNDQLKTNTVLQMKDAGIEFKTI